MLRPCGQRCRACPVGQHGGWRARARAALAPSPLPSRPRPRPRRTSRPRRPAALAVQPPSPLLLSSPPSPSLLTPPPSPRTFHRHYLCVSGSPIVITIDRNLSRRNAFDTAGSDVTSNEVPHTLLDLVASVSRGATRGYATQTNKCASASNVKGARHCPNLPRPRQSTPQLTRPLQPPPQLSRPHQPTPQLTRPLQPPPQLTRPRQRTPQLTRPLQPTPDLTES